MNNIALSTKVQTAINAILDGSVNPIVIPDDGKIYVLNTENVEFGSLLYTVFDEDTRFPEVSYSVKYGHQHTIHQALYSSFIRYEMKGILDSEIPDLPRSDWEPLIIPTIGRVHPTDVEEEQPQLSAMSNFIRKNTPK